MKPSPALFIGALLLAALWLGFASYAQAQAVSILHNFGDGSVSSDGLVSVAGLVQGLDGNFYGTTVNGGSAAKGAVFKATSQGAVTILHSFGDGSVAGDGANPTASLIQGLDGNFYGPTSNGGSAGKGTVFMTTPQGTLTLLHSFGDGSVPNDGVNPTAGLIQGLDGNFYGTTSSGGSAGKGTVFEITKQKVVTIVHSFGDGTVNNDGVSPGVGLVQDARGNFYGTTLTGGSSNQGAVYVINSQRQESILYSFGKPSSFSFTLGASPHANGAGGYFPNSRLLLGSDGNLYGTTAASFYGNGAIFKITPQGQETVLHYFGDGTVGSDGSETSSVGAPGENLLVQGSDGNFYGTTNGGGSAGKGVLFKITPQGQVTIFHSFLDGAVPNDGATPEAGMIQGSDGNFYGTTSSGGSSGGGVLFKVVPGLPPITGALTMTSILNAFGSTSQGFSYQITASGSPTRFGATGLPAGLLLNVSTGTISGTPAVTGTFPVTITAANMVASTSKTLMLAITGAAPTLSQEYVLLHNFNDGSVAQEGTYPAALIQGLDNTFYGVTAQGGGSGSGTICNLSAAGSASVFSGWGGANGSAPQGLVQGSDGNFYGTTQNGGSANLGTVFKMTPAGAMTVLHTLGDGSVAHDGANPQAGVIQGLDGNFYGTTQNGGSANLGTVFKMTPAGVVTVLHSFGDGSVTNDGAAPVAALLQLSNGTFYGTTQNGGSANSGTVFTMTLQGSVTILHSFADGTISNDGYLPHASLIQIPGGNLVGTTFIGGTVGKGTVFQITLAGVVTILHNFGDGSVTNDGINPLAPLVGCPNGLFGTTQNGGAAGQGAVFEIDASGHFTIIHSFGDGSVTNDGANPVAGLCLGADGNLYGTTLSGGAGYGIVYAIVANLTPAKNFPASSWTLTGVLPLGMTFDPSAGTISGLPLSSDSAGTYTLSITQIVNGQPSMPQTVAINLVAQPTRTFSQWAASYSIANSATAVLENDGVPNLLKYLYDINPTVPMSASDRAALPVAGMTTVGGTTYLALTYRQYAQATGITINVQTSSDLQTWTTVTPDIAQQFGTDPNTGDPMIQVGVNTDGLTREFIRLNVTSP